MAMTSFSFSSFMMSPFHVHRRELPRKKSNSESILCADGNQSYIKVAEAGAGIIHKRLIAKEHHRVEDDVFHIQTLNNYVSRWRGWMRKFHRVGTAYLANYLGWFRVTVQEPNTARSWMQGGANT
ncbi:hypothetical protein [Aeromonas media]|uniref:hypothetical protein n=1 Tax=Aeromonas media TaxID=651 RepID=UPI003CFDDB8D